MILYVPANDQKFSELTPVLKIITASYITSLAEIIKAPFSWDQTQKTTHGHVAATKFLLELMEKS